MTQGRNICLAAICRIVCSILLSANLVSSSLHGADVDFEAQIRPLLQKHCVQCHGAGVQKSGLRLDARSVAFRGGDGGSVIVPGDSVGSELIRRVRSQDGDVKMPPTGGELTQAEIDLLTLWIDQGATWVETDADRLAVQDPRLNHWAWQPLLKSQVPKQGSALTDLSLPHHEIDRFIAAKHSEHGLTFSPEADRRTLLRRLSFDLTGLPPTPELVQQFLSDTDPQAYERVVDSLLASPHYGERWARHWLDIAHYADTHGFERDQRRDHAWRYRDWVIRAINADLPYDQFLKDQIAGDVLRPDDPDAVAATGFLAAGPWDFVGQAETPSPVLKRLARADDLDDMITQVMTAACGVTINCARCHDHKLDPISQREYFSLAAVFSGVKRADRVLSVGEEKRIAEQKQSLEAQLSKARSELALLRRKGWSLADIVGSGDGHGSAKVGQAIDPLTGKSITDKRGFLENAAVNAFVAADLPFVDGVVILNGGASGEVVISSTGLVAQNVPKTSGQAWDAIRNGPVNSQFSTTLGGIEFAGEEHSLLSLHANSAITFDLNKMRSAGLPSEVRLRGQVGYFGQTTESGASVHVFLDGQPAYKKLGLGRDDGLQDIEISIGGNTRFLTLMSTDHGNGIGHDQICFADLQLEPQEKDSDDTQNQRVDELTKQVQELQRQLVAVPEVPRIYSVVPETPPATHVHRRGNPEDQGDEVFPGAISCVSALNASFGERTLTDAQRRIALANWIASSENPLTSRVIVNRLWHHHFGRGLVDTPSDFGLGGSLPSHPELLDWLAEQLIENGWSLKSMHRRICLSRTYRQSSSAVSATNDQEVAALDAGNHLLWRQNARRLDAESVRDAVLHLSGKLNTEMYGPGYRDFEYKEEYAPVYSYVTADRPELWRRSIYRFTVRTTPDQFLATLDCPNAANLTPARNVTTTALQALALMNNDFMLRQSHYMAERVASEIDATSDRRIQRAFQLAYARNPSPEEMTAARLLHQQRDLAELCRALLNSNEFHYVD